MISNQLQLLEDHLSFLGYRYPDGAVVSGYTFAAGKGKTAYADLLAFSDPRRYDISTSCIAVRLWPNGHSKENLLAELSYIGVPLAVFALPEYVEIQAVARPSSAPHETSGGIVVSYEEIKTYFSEHQAELSPRSLLNAKRGVRQLSFLSVDPSLEAFAREATQKTLVDQFEYAVASAFSKMRSATYSKRIIRLAIWILAARILQDKLGGDLQGKVAPELLDAVQAKFPNHFHGLSRDLSTVGRDVADQLYSALCGDFTFRSLTNDMLAYFYENTLVRPDLRKKLGIYYTPRTITERIIRRLPIEDIPREDRRVLDGTCGSGNLLLSACDRLCDLLPVRWSPDQKHDYLLAHIWGNDKDPFACEIARLSLLLYDLPSGDSWNIHQGNVFDIKPKSSFGNDPAIIVGNPPFEEASPCGGEERVQKAAQILDLYLRWLTPGGLLGVVMPLTFLHNGSTREARDTLLSTCDVLEVWHLPEGAIPASRFAVAVILARKLLPDQVRTRSLLTRVEEVFRPEWVRFGRDHEPSASYTVSQDSWSSDSGTRMVSSPLGAIFRRVSDEFPCAEPEFCIIRNGIKAPESTYSSHSRGKGWRAALHSNVGSRVLEPFGISWENEAHKYVDYESTEIERARNPEHFDRPTKVVMNGARNSNNPWRFMAAVDREKLVVSENFYYVLPAKGVTCEELAALFNSLPVNAWYAGQNYQWNLIADDIRQIPMPHFDEKQRAEIRKEVRRIEKLKKQFPRPQSEEIQELIGRLDEIIFDAYRIDAGERSRIRNLMNYFKRPGREWRGERSFPPTPEPYKGRRWVLSGQVEEINVERHLVSMWIQGRGQCEIRIPDCMPGWSLRPGVAFNASMAWTDRNKTDLATIKWLDFSALDYGYLSDEQLLYLLKENTEP